MLVPQGLNEFETYKAKSITTKTKETSTRFDQVFRECETAKWQVLHQVMNENIEKLFKMVSEIEAQRNSDQKVKIYPILVKENQLNELPMFMKKITDRLYKTEKECQRIFDHPCDEVLIKQRQGYDAREILLDIYDDFSRLGDDVDFNFFIYVVSHITDLSEENLYIFSKGITNRNFIAFIPTFQTFAEQNYESINKLRLQKFLTPIYDSKQTFCKYIYSCIKDPKIKAYMPPEILNLVTDMNFYHIGYTESCRRFNYCLLKALQLNPNQPPQLKIQKEIDNIESILRNKFKHRDYVTCWHNILKVILDQEEVYKISNAVVSVEISLRNGKLQSDKNVEYESEFMENLTHSFKRHLDKNSLAIFQLYEASTEQTIVSTRQRKLDRYGVNKIKNVTPKQQLENKITRVIKTLTKQVRKHAKTLKWGSFRFIQRIKPSIPMRLVDSMKRQDQVIELVQDITSQHCSPISNLLSYFDKESIGYGLYLIKTLEFSGLIVISKKEINPHVYNNFYQKARFN